MHKSHVLYTFVLAIVLGLTPAVAQQQSGLVNVNLSDIKVQLSDVLDVDVSQIPVTVQVPVGVAANVCPNANVAALAQAAQSGEAECTAQNTSQALNQIVQRRIGGGQQGQQNKPQQQ
jgi:hypothetical protein